MAHITAGDLAPLTYQHETTYGQGDGTDVLYGEIAEGGALTLQDTATPYKAWRYGSRGYSRADYVGTQHDAAYTADLEARDKAGWEAIVINALGTASTASNPYGPLPSRTVKTYVRTGAQAWQGRIYHGVKTDGLTISAEAPGAVVRFSEQCLASYGEDSDITAPLVVWSDDTPGVQWLGATTIDGTEVYPQSLSVGIANAVDRVRAPPDDTHATSYTKALVEGRREITIDLDLWMEDMGYLRGAMDNGNIGNVAITLGNTQPVRIAFSGVAYAGGSTTPLANDKQRQTVRLIASDASVTVI